MPEALELWGGEPFFPVGEAVILKRWGCTPITSFLSLSSCCLAPKLCGGMIIKAPGFWLEDRKGTLQRTEKYLGVSGEGGA